MHRSDQLLIAFKALGTNYRVLLCLGRKLCHYNLCVMNHDNNIEESNYRVLLCLISFSINDITHGLKLGSLRRVVVRQLEVWSELKI